MSLTLDIGGQNLLRELAPAVLAGLVRRFRDFSSAEDALQEALLAAATQWPREGVPENPRGWLMRVAMRRLTDQLRAEGARQKREAIVVSWVPAEEQMALSAEDSTELSLDTLDLLFICCDAALSAPSAIALTLRAVGGLTTSEVASAFLVPEATMAQRISRAKQTIKASGRTFRRSVEQEQAARLGAVSHVLYLMFSEGYAVSSGPTLQRTDLANEALRLTRLLRELAPDDCEVGGLLALMLLTDARREARTGSAGELIPLDRQDRARWDQAAIREGVQLLSATLPRGALGPYQVQAAIAALHDEATSTETTDWRQIRELYRLLAELAPSPLVALNEAVAVAMVDGPAAGLRCLDALANDDVLRTHHRLDAVRAHLLERAGDHEGAIGCYLRAVNRTTSSAERNYLLLCAARLRR